MSSVQALDSLNMLLISLFNDSISFFFQFTRSHRNEKDKAPVNDGSSSSEPDEGNLSLMDRTKRLAKAARDQEQQALDIPVEDEVQDLEELVRRTRERVKAVKSAKSRAADLRRELQELEEEEQSVIAEADHPPASATVPVPAVVEAIPASVPAAIPAVTDPGALVAASLDSAVIVYLIIYFIIHFYEPFFLVLF